MKAGCRSCMLALLTVTSACGSGSPGVPGRQAAAGTVGGACRLGAMCDAGLICVDGTCSNRADGGAERKDASACAADTLSDPKNCGSCGRVCHGICVAGQCTATFGGCFDRNQFDSCEAFCSSINQNCAQAACNGATWLSWSNGFPSQCMQADSPGSRGQTGCSDALPSRDSTTYSLFNCCCR